MSDFWSKKLGTQPLGITVRPQPIHQQQPQQVMTDPYQRPIHHEPAPQPESLATITYQQVAREHDGEKISHFWKGGEAIKTESHLACPQCGNSTSYTAYSGMAGAAASIAGNRPRPHCFECGYNGLYIQGDQANWS